MPGSTTQHTGHASSEQQQQHRGHGMLKAHELRLMPYTAPSMSISIIISSRHSEEHNTIYVLCVRPQAPAGRTARVPGAQRPSASRREAMQHIYVLLSSAI